MLASKIFNFYQNSIEPNFNVPAAAISGGTGHFLVDHQITGIMVLDMFLKIFVPIATGILVPIIKSYFEDRKDARNLRREELKAKENECSGK